MNQEKESFNEPWWQPALSLFMRLSVWVTFPVVIATFIGHWLDKKYDSSPFGLIGVVGIAFVLSMIGLVYEAAKEYKIIVKNNNKHKVEDKKIS